MDWTTITWRSFEGPLAAILSPESEVLRSALEEAASAHASAPVALRAVDVAAGDLKGILKAADVTAIATFELLGSPRRGAWAALDSSTGDTLAGAPVDAASFGGVIALAADEALLAVFGNGLNLGEPAAAPTLPSRGMSAIRFLFVGPDGIPLGAVLAIESVAIDELAAHLEAIRAMGASPAAAGPAARAASAATPAAPAAPVAPAQPVPTVRPATYEELTPRQVQPAGQSIELLLGVNLQVTVEIGRTMLPIRDILALAPGSIVELDKLAGQQVDVLVNDHAIAHGEVVVVDENFGVRIMSIVSRSGRIASAGAA